MRDSDEVLHWNTATLLHTSNVIITYTTRNQLFCLIYQRVLKNKNKYLSLGILKDILHM